MDQDQYYQTQSVLNEIQAYVFKIQSAIQSLYKMLEGVKGNVYTTDAIPTLLAILEPLQKEIGHVKYFCGQSQSEPVLQLTMEQSSFNQQIESEVKETSPETKDELDFYFTNGTFNNIIDQIKKQVIKVEKDREKIRQNKIDTFNQLLSDFLVRVSQENWNFTKTANERNILFHEFLMNLHYYGKQCYKNISEAIGKKTLGDTIFHSLMVRNQTQGIFLKFLKYIQEDDCKKFIGNQKTISGNRFREEQFREQIKTLTLRYENGKTVKEQRKDQQLEKKVLEKVSPDQSQQPLQEKKNNNRPRRRRESSGNEKTVKDQFHKCHWEYVGNYRNQMSNEPSSEDVSQHSPSSTQINPDIIPLQFYQTNNTTPSELIQITQNYLPRKQKPLFDMDLIPSYMQEQYIIVHQLSDGFQSIIPGEDNQSIEECDQSEAQSEEAQVWSPFHKQQE